MIRWLRRRLLEDRLFRSPGHKNAFLRGCAFANTEVYVHQASRLKQAIHKKEKGEAIRRKHFLSLEGFNAPKTMKQCDKFIEDIRKWREI